MWNINTLIQTQSNNKVCTLGFLQKERDLELAARIGQSLLKKNKALSERNELLEEQVEHIREEVNYTMCEIFLQISVPISCLTPPVPKCRFRSCVTTCP